MNTLWILALNFFQIGLFAVGGGLATLPFLTELSQKYPAWFTAPTLADIIAIAESTPGPIGVNAATFAGYSAAGVPGAVLSTVSLVAPSFIIVCFISGVLERYRSSRLVESVFFGLRPAVAGLIAAAAYSMLRLSLFSGDIAAAGLLEAISWPRIALFAFILASTQVKPTKKLHPALLIALGAVCGAVFPL